VPSCPPSLQATYLRMYNRTLESDIVDDTSGTEKEFFVGLINVRVCVSVCVCVCALAHCNKYVLVEVLKRKA